jgi:hypothetical protein
MASRTSRWSLGNLFGLKKPAPPPRTDTRYHAVSIIPGPTACAAAKRFVGQRLLSGHAPPLPLPSCDAAHCDCRFKHHRDRRAGPRRRIDVGLMPAAYSGAERRRGAQGRRADDY